MRVRRVGTMFLLVAGAVLASAGGAPAAPPKETPTEWAQKAITALSKGTIQEIADLGDQREHPVDINGVAKDLDLALTFARVVHDEAPRRVLESLQTARVFVIYAQQVAGSMKAQKPADHRTKRALAYALVAQGRLLAVRGAPAEFDQWLLAGDLAAQSYESAEGKKDGGEFAAAAVGWMRAAAAMLGADVAAFSKRADALAAILAATPESPSSVVGRATAKLMAIDVLLKQTPPPAPAALKAPIEEVVAILTPHAKPGGNLDACALWQECVTVARSRKVAGLKIDYLLGPPAVQLNVTWQMPLSSQWKDAGPAGDDPAYVANFEQRLPDGRVLHRVEVRMYRWDKRYGIAEAAPFKGDSTKELILAVQGYYKKTFSSISSQKDVSRGALSDSMQGAQTFEIEGTSATTGEPRAVRSFVVRGKDTKGTFLIVANTFGTAPPGDPELDAVLNTFREVKAGK